MAWAPRGTRGRRRPKPSRGRDQQTVEVRGDRLVRLQEVNRRTSFRPVLLIECCEDRIGRPGGAEQTFHLRLNRAQRAFDLVAITCRRCSISAVDNPCAFSIPRCGSPERAPRVWSGSCPVAFPNSTRISKCRRLSGSASAMRSVARSNDARLSRSVATSGCSGPRIAQRWPARRGGAAARPRPRAGPVSSSNNARLLKPVATSGCSGPWDRSSMARPRGGTAARPRPRPVRGPQQLGQVVEAGWRRRGARGRGIAQR